VPIHGREAHVGHFIELPQLLHDELADHSRSDLAIARRAHLVGDAAQRLIHLRPRHGTLLQRLLHAGAKLGFIEGLACAIALDDRGHDQLRGLESGEPLAAGEALAAPADLTPFARQAGVGDLRLDVAAEWAVHASTRSDRSPARTRTLLAVHGEPPAELEHLTLYPLHD